MRKTVRSTHFLAMALLSSLASSAWLTAAEPATTADETKPLIPVKLQVVFTEYEGAKKLTSLPYILTCVIGGVSGSHAKLRMGMNVPIETGGPQTIVQYQDVGTDIDCSGHPLGDGRFTIEFSMRRSFVYMPNGDAAAPTSGQSDVSLRPILGNFQSSFTVLLRDGQTTQATLATDPQSGRVLKIDITLTVVK